MWLALLVGVVLAIVLSSSRRAARATARRDRARYERAGADLSAHQPARCARDAVGARRHRLPPGLAGHPHTARRRHRVSARSTSSSSGADLSVSDYRDRCVGPVDGARAVGIGSRVRDLGARARSALTRCDSARTPGRSARDQCRRTGPVHPHRGASRLVPGGNGGCDTYRHRRRGRSSDRVRDLELHGA